MLISTQHASQGRAGASQNQTRYLQVPGYKPRLAYDQIVWIQGDGNYSRIHLANGGQVVTCRTLRLLEELVPEMIRIHKSSIVNPLFIRAFRYLPEQRAGYIVLSNGVELLIARRRFELIAGLFGQTKSA